jgi:hypothetical protein
MVVSANFRHCNRRFIVASWLFAGLFLAGAVLTAGKADASCGDYLLHGPTDFATTLGQDQNLDPNRRSGLGVLANERARDTHPLPQPPTSPCAGGRCQSAPPHPPANSPTRAVYVKQPVALDSFASLDSEPDARDWLYPADGLRPEGPWIAVDLPPPKRAILHV